jgi:hypothetical protein
MCGRSCALEAGCFGRDFREKQFFRKLLLQWFGQVPYIPRSISPGGENWGVKRYCSNADDKSTRSLWTKEIAQQVQGSGLADLALPAGCVHPGDDADAQEAEFGDAESRQGSPDQRI